MKDSRLPVLLVILLLVSLTVSGFLAFQVRFRADAARRPAQPAPELVPFAALGSSIAENSKFRDLGWTEAQFEALLAGMRATYEGRGYPLDDDARRLREEISARVNQMLEAEQPDPVATYFKQLRDREAVTSTASGLHYRITLEGAGAPPLPADMVVVSYAARTPDGTTLPALTGVRVRARVTDLLPGLAEGVQLVRPGGKALVYLPGALSFGTGEWPAGVPRGMPIGFFLELHEVVAEESK